MIEPTKKLTQQAIGANPQTALGCRGAAVCLLSLIVMHSSGCKLHAPPGRCGIQGPCDPVVMCDPFVNDQCTPPKNVEPDHFGYVRPQWRVLGSREPQCCAPMAPQTVDSQLLEIEGPSMLPVAPKGEDVPAVEGGAMPLVPAEALDPELLDTESQALPAPRETGLIPPLGIDTTGRYSVAPTGPSAGLGVRKEITDGVARPARYRITPHWGK